MRWSWAAGVVAAVGILCYYRGRHTATRHPLGGFKCSDCDKAGYDLDDMGFTGGGYVRPLRRVFERNEGGGSSMTSEWERSRKGTW